MDKLTFRKYLAWIVVAFVLMILPTLGHANIALTGKEFQALFAQENIVGYELTKVRNPAYNVYNPGGAPMYYYQSQPVYYDPYMPETARSIKPVSQSPVRYAQKTPVKDLLNIVDVNGKKIFCVPDGTTAIAQSGAGAIAKRALTGLPSLMLMELANPDVLADGTIAGSGYELGVLSDSSDPEITAAELQARIALRHGIDTTAAVDVDYSDGIVTYNGQSYTVGPSIEIVEGMYGWIGWSNMGAGISWDTGAPIYIAGSNVFVKVGPGSVSSYWGGTYTRYSRHALISSAPAPAFNPADYPHIFGGSQGAFNALAELIISDAKVEMIPLDPSLMPTYFPDTSTGFMRFGGKTDIAGENYLLGPYGTLYKKPDSMEVDPSLPYVDPASIGYIANSPGPGGVPNIIPGSIPGIPQGSTILDIDPVTGLIKFKTPQGYESSKYGTPQEVQDLQRKVASPYYDGSGQPWGYSSSSFNSTSNSTTGVTVIADREDYSVDIPDIPGPPEFPSTFDVPEPEPWPWQQWISNPISTILDNMGIEASGSPTLVIPVNLGWYDSFTITIDFSEYESHLSTIGGYMVALAYITAVLYVVRARK